MRFIIDYHWGDTRFGERLSWASIILALGISAATIFGALGYYRSCVPEVQERDVG